MITADKKSHAVYFNRSGSFVMTISNSHNTNTIHACACSPNDVESITKQPFEGPNLQFKRDISEKFLLY